MPVIKAKRKRIIADNTEDSAKKGKAEETVGGGGALGSLLGGYGSSDSDSD